MLLNVDPRTSLRRFRHVLKGQEHLNQVDVHVFRQLLVYTDVRQAHVCVHMDFPQFVELVGHVPVGVVDRKLSGLSGLYGSRVLVKQIVFLPNQASIITITLLDLHHQM